MKIVFIVSDKFLNQDADANRTVDIFDRQVFAIQFVGTHDDSSIKQLFYICRLH